MKYMKVLKQFSNLLKKMCPNENASNVLIKGLVHVVVLILQVFVFFSFFFFCY